MNMKCSQCGTENKDGSVFCKECGSRLTAEAAPAGPVFCPNCGKKFENGEAFCDECGTNLDVQAGPQEPVKKGGKSKKIVLAAVGVVAAAAVVLVGGSFVLGGLGGSKEKAESNLVYFTDDGLMLADLKSKKEPVLVTDSYCKGREYREEFSGYLNTCMLTKDGKYLYYFEDYDGETFKLYRVPVKKAGKKDAGVEIDTRVQDFQVLDNGNILYRKKDDLYLYSGKKESVKIASDVVNGYTVDKDGKYVCWGEDAEVGYTYYLQDLAMKNDKVRLAREAENFYKSSDLTSFYALSDGKLEKIDAKGEATRIDRDVTGLGYFSAADGWMYYTKSEVTEIPYIDLIEDDKKDMKSYEKENLKENHFTYEKKQLYYYEDGKSTLVCDDYMEKLAINKGFYLVMKGGDITDVHLKWSDVKHSSWDSAVREELQAEPVRVLYKDGKQIAEYDDLVNPVGFMVADDASKMCFFDVDHEEKDGTIYEITLTGKNAGERKTLLEDAYDCKLVALTKDGLYSMRDLSDEGEGDLYLDDKKVATDIFEACVVGREEGLMAVQSDYYDKDDTFAVSLMKNGKPGDTIEEINGAEAAKDGTLICMQNYSRNSNEGELVYFDGKKLKKIDDSAIGFVRRRNTIYLYGK